MAHIFLFFIHFFHSFPKLQVTIKNLCLRFLRNFKARMLKLCIHMDNELLYCGIENRTPCSYSSLYLSIVLSFTATFVSQFSPELYKLESSNIVYICRKIDCIVGLRLRVMASHFSIFHLFFFLSLSFMLTLKKLC